MYAQYPSKYADERGPGMITKIKKGVKQIGSMLSSFLGTSQDELVEFQINQLDEIKN